jgi:argininosuccinate lyase
VKVGQEIENNEFEFEPGNLEHTHQGSIGNLCLDKIEYQFNKLKNKLLG